MTEKINIFFLKSLCILGMLFLMIGWILYGTKMMSKHVDNISRRTIGLTFICLGWLLCIYFLLMIL